MSEYAQQPTNTTNAFLNPRVYWKVSAFALSAVALLGIVVNIFAGNNEGLDNFLKFDWAHNVLHVVLAGAAFLFGFGNFSGQITKTFAIIFGFVYLGLGVVGLIGGLTFELAGLLSLELGENLVHVVLGGWALTAGFAARYD
ncbi:MAG: hypothetical protein ACPHK8_04620 [Thermoplasmatota archaeon]